MSSDWSWLVRGSVLERDGWRISRVGPAGARRYALWAPERDRLDPAAVLAFPTLAVDPMSKHELVGVYSSAGEAKARADGAP